MVEKVSVSYQREVMSGERAGSGKNGGGGLRRKERCEAEDEKLARNGHRDKLSARF